MIYIAYVRIQKDVTKIKTKLIGKMSARQAIFIPIGAAFGLAAFFMFRGLDNMITNMAIFTMSMPFFVMSSSKGDIMPEKKLLYYLRYEYFFPKKRIYRKVEKDARTRNKNNNTKTTKTRTSKKKV